MVLTKTKQYNKQGFFFFPVNKYGFKMENVIIP